MNDTIFDYLCTFLDENGVECEIALSGPLQFELKYDDKPIFRLLEYTNDGDEDIGELQKLSKKLNVKCTNLKFAYIEDGKNYNLKSYDSINYIYTTFQFIPRSDFNNNSSISKYKFMKVLEVR